MLVATKGVVALCAFMLAVLLLPAGAPAAVVPGLYGAVVDLPRGVQEPLRAAFDEALAQVLVKVTGLPDAGSAAARSSLFPDAARLVQQYSLQSGDKVQVEFSATAVRQVLDKAGLPVWGGDRPLVAVWLAVDAGGGRRYIIADNSDAYSGADGGSTDAAMDELRMAVSDAAGQRGLPVVLPLVDGVDLAQLSFADLWGDFQAPVLAASQRYGAEAILIGRSRSMNPAEQGVRWTLVAGDEQAAWQGDISSGPAEASAFLSRRLATYADSAGSLRVLVTGVDSLSKYGKLTKYFHSLSIVDSVGTARVDGNNVEFDLVVRGDSGRLGRELRSSRLLLPVEKSFALPAASASSEYGRLPDLTFAWAEAP